MMTDYETTWITVLRDDLDHLVYQHGIDAPAEPEVMQRLRQALADTVPTDQMKIARAVIDRNAPLFKALADGDVARDEIQQRMMARAIDKLIADGLPPDEAKAQAIAALYAPSRFKLPTIDELDEPQCGWIA